MIDHLLVILMMLAVYYFLEFLAWLAGKFFK